MNEQWNSTRGEQLWNLVTNAAPPTRPPPLPIATPLSQLEDGGFLRMLESGHMRRMWGRKRRGWGEAGKVAIYDNNNIKNLVGLCCQEPGWKWDLPRALWWCFSNQKIWRRDDSRVAMRHASDWLPWILPHTVSSPPSCPSTSADHPLAARYPGGAVALI